MKKIILGFLVVWGILAAESCTEKELVMPENQQEEVLETLTTRPSLRPDSVKAYPAFYNSVEIVFPEEQPERAVKGVITYTKDDGSEALIEVTDFDEVILIENLSIKPYSFSIVYYNAEGKASGTVIRTVTPYSALTDYSYNTLAGYGELGTAYIHWQNITGKEVEITVSYEQGGETKSASRLSTKLRDTIVIKNLPNVDLVFDVQVKDLVRDYASDVKQLTINPGLSVENYALSTLQIAPGFGRAFLTWENPVEVDLRLNLSYVVGGQPKTTTYETSATNGTYTLVNLPQGAMNIQANFTNLVTNDVSNNKALAVTVDKGVKETVSEALVLDSYSYNFAIAKIANPTSIPVDVQVAYEKSTGGTYEQILTVASGMSNYLLPLYNVKADGEIIFTVTDDIGDLDRNIQSTVSTPASIPAPNTPIELNRTGWVPTASSYRSLTARASELLDGVYGTGNENATNGWVSAWGSPILNPDSLGKASTSFPHYIQVDMLDVKYVTGVSFINHGNGTQNGPGQFIVQYSFDGKTFYDGQTMQRTLTGRNVRTHHYLDNPLIARYIRIYIVSGDNGNPSNGVTRIAEFYIYGSE